MQKTLFTAALAALAAEYATVTAQSTGYQYVRQTLYQGTDFFNGFQFFSSADPTQGYVQYVNQTTAAANNLTATTPSSVYMGVDFTTHLSNSAVGRQSVRIESNQLYTYGLFIADVAHMPTGCGTWPAWWSYGANWPYQGEIDVIEGVNSAQANLMSMHTGANCTVAGSGQLGTLLYNDCDQFSSTESGTGCATSYSTAPGAAQAYGDGFNKNGGGVYATEWTPNWIRVYFFPRGAIPADITAGAPTPANWGLPLSNFQGSCDVPSHFQDHHLVFDTTFCGNWAGAVWSSDPVCSQLAPTCQSYVQNNPAAFQNAYWLVNYVAVYQQQPATTSTFTSTSTSTSISTSTTSTSTTTTTSTSSTSHTTSPSSSTTTHSTATTSSTSTHTTSSSTTTKKPTTNSTSTTTKKPTTTTTTSKKPTTTSKHTTTTSKHPTTSTHHLSSVKPNTTLRKVANAAAGATGVSVSGVPKAKSATTTKKITQSIPSSALHSSSARH